MDLLDFRLVKQIALQAAPTAVVPGPKPSRTYVLTPASGSIHAIDQSLNRVATAKFADELSELRLTPDGNTLVSISASARELLFIDAASFRLLHRLPFEHRPVSLDIAADGAIAVALGASGDIYLVRPGGAVVRTQLETEAAAVRFRLDSKLLIVSRPKTRALSVLNVPGLQVLAELPLAMQPQHLCFTPDGGQLFVTGKGMDAVAIVFPYNTLEVEQTVLAGRDPGAMACCDDPLLLFVGNETGSDLSILDVDSRKVIALVGVGTHPRFIAITPDTQYALVMNEASGDVAVLRVPAIHRNRAKNGASLFTLVPVGAQPVHAAVIRRA